MAYEQPPWVTRPADPAAHYAQGFQIGVHLGAQQAAHAFQAQQLAQQQQKMALAQQQQEFENQYQAQVLSLKAGEMARQHQAAQMYSQMVGSGMDPLRALMQLAPELGESPATIMHNQALREQAQQNMLNRQERLQFEQGRESRIATQADQRIKDAEERAARAEADRKAALEFKTKSESDKAERAKTNLAVKISSDPQIRLIDQRLQSANQALIAKTAGNMFPLGSKQSYQKAIDDLEEQRKARVRQITGQEEAIQSVDVAGENTMPDKPIRKRWTGTEFVPVQ